MISRQIMTVLLAGWLVMTLTGGHPARSAACAADRSAPQDLLLPVGGIRRLPPDNDEPLGPPRDSGATNPTASKTRNWFALPRLPWKKSAPPSAALAERRAAPSVADVAVTAEQLREQLSAAYSAEQIGRASCRERVCLYV